MSKLDTFVDENFPDNELLRMDGFDDCAVGVVERFGQEPIICYDRAKVIRHLMLQGMTEDDAEEYFAFNQIGAWMGDATPCFITIINKKGG